jgi:formate hydrogenlyase transcriptional activator
LQEIRQLKERLEQENIYLRKVDTLDHVHDEIIGQSEAIRHVLQQAEKVAPTNSSVLLQGETGTGKELVAQLIHRFSPRHNRLMVKVNCSALPATLIESELFGREKGAFTGALTRQAGRFEIADGSTIFLDEIGDLPLDLQAKLLQVLQEGRFERLGSSKTLQVDVRVIAATNRDLSEEVRRGNFRQDLYYRLNVFPIQMPPLRERAEDIPLMIQSFVGEYAGRLGRKIRTVPRRVMEALQRYPWPGNIRELRNVIERAVIISPGETLEVDLPGAAPGNTPPVSTLAQAEAGHIRAALKQTGGRIKGAGGAAALLGLNPSTLYTRMKKLGLTTRNQDLRS